MRLRRGSLTEPVTVAAHLGRGAHGSTYAPPVTVLGDVQSSQKVVRSATGEELTARLLLRFTPYCLDQAGGEHDTMHLLTPGSRVTHRGQDSTVVDVIPHTAHGRVEYVEVATT